MFLQLQETLHDLRHDFLLLTKWSHEVGLVLNAIKTKLMYINSSKNRVTALSLIAHNHAYLHADQYDCVPTRSRGISTNTKMLWTYN